MERNPTLAELQRWLRSRFVGETPSGPDWARAVADVPPIPREQRLAIYANAYHWRLLEVLSEDFEATGRSVTWCWGFDRWEAIVRAFLLAHPSRSEDLGLVGAPFASFLEARPEAAELPWLPHLARLEREVVAAFRAPDLPPLSAERLALLADSGGVGVRFTFAPSVRLVDSPWPVLGAWNRRGRSGDPGFPRSPRRQWIRLSRGPRGSVLGSVEPDGAAQILRRLEAGETLDRACRDARNASRVGAWFLRWMAEGVFSDLALDQ